jgi:hypothetical protein
MRDVVQQRLLPQRRSCFQIITLVCASGVVRISPVLGRYIPSSTYGPSSVTSVRITTYPITSLCARRIVGKAVVVCGPSADRLTRGSKSMRLKRSALIAAKIYNAQSAQRSSTERSTCYAHTRSLWSGQHVFVTLSLMSDFVDE